MVEGAALKPETENAGHEDRIRASFAKQGLMRRAGTADRAVDRNDDVG
jgi:hypothetical protein